MQWFSAVLRRIAGIQRCSKDTCFIFFTCAGKVIVMPSSSALAVYAESYVVLCRLCIFKLKRYLYSTRCTALTFASMLSLAPVLTSKVPELPVLTAALKMYESLAKRGFENEGTQSIIRYYMD